jgi:hypothetical protein
MTRSLLVVLASACLAALLTACAGDETPSGRWSGATVWQFRVDAAVWVPCNVQSPAMLKGDEPCIVEVMKQGGASRSAIDFYEQQRFFLVSFDEKGRVDYGRGGAPWVNMGRTTQQLFLNGDPDIIHATLPRPAEWQEQPSYAGVLRQEPNVFPWLEYGTLAGATSDSRGGQSFEIDFPMRVCRACPDLGLMPVTYHFDRQGKLASTEIGPFKPK